MSKSDSAAVLTAQIDALTAHLDQRLRRLHLDRSDRRAIVGEVRGDLQAAAADGVSPAALIGSDIDAFAREAIEAGGYRPRPPEYLRVLVGGSLAAAATVVTAYWLIVGLIQPVFASWFTLEGRYPSVGPYVVYGAVALVGVIGALAALAWVVAGRPASRETTMRAALLVPLAAAAGIAGAVGVARGPDYTVTGTTVTTQVVLVALPVVAALAVSRWWALRTSTHIDDLADTSHIMT